MNPVKCNEGSTALRPPLHILSILGTRPEAIKMAPVLKELRQRPDQIRYCVVVTAQHRQMLDQVLVLFGIEPDYDLDLMREGQTLAQITCSVLTALDEVFAREQPELILAQGDTTTVLVAALTAYYHRVPFGHIEAGLRTGDNLQPYPEEINRRVADIVADFHFAPTQAARQNLLREGITQDSIYVTGNTVIDALLDVATRDYTPDGPLAMLNADVRVILVTAHRRENFGRPIKNICAALLKLAHTYPDVRTVYPVHLNPNIQQPVYSLLANTRNITLLPPLDYRSFVWLMKRATLILTDSGGLQEEAPTLGKPVLVMRETTERPEAVEAGTVRLVGTDIERIFRETCRLLDDPAAYDKMAKAINPFGDGTAAQQIVDIIVREYGLQ